MSHYYRKEGSIMNMGTVNAIKPMAYPLQQNEDLMPLFNRIGDSVPTIVPLRYAAFIYLDKTSALHPLPIKPDAHQFPETYPFGV